MPSYKPFSEWYLLALGPDSTNGTVVQSNTGRSTPIRTPSPSSTDPSVRELNNGFYVNPDGRVFWGNTMSVGEPFPVNVCAARGVDLSKKHLLIQDTQGAIYDTTNSNTKFYNCGQGHPPKRGRRLSQSSAPPSRRNSAGSVSSHSTFDNQEFGMGTIRKDSRDSQVQFMGDIKHKYRVKRDGNRLYEESVISPNFSQKGGKVLPADELLLKKRSPSKTSLKTYSKPAKKAQDATNGKPALKHRSSSLASSASGSISSHESYGSEHSVSGEFANVGFNEAGTHYLNVPFGARAKNTYHRSRDGKKSKPGLLLTKADFGRPVESVEQADLIVAGGILNQRRVRRSS